MICEPDDRGWSCSVTIGFGAGMTRHEVTVTPAELDRFAPGATEPESLVKRSVRFLLERESKESILRRFALLDIARYFPDYPVVIGRD